jgi:hypothetical protein
VIVALWPSSIGERGAPRGQIWELQFSLLILLSIDPDIIRHREG